MGQVSSPRNRAERRAAMRASARRVGTGSIAFTASTAAFAAALLGGSAVPAGAASQTFNVDSSADAAPVAAHCTDVTLGNCTLRDAIAAANANVDAANPDVITFDPSVLPLITLSQGQMVISDSLTISGPGASALSVKGTGNRRIFYLNGPGNLDVVISGLTLTHDATKVTGPGSAGGGAVRNTNEHLTIQDSVLTGNTTSGYGGALYADTAGNTLTILRSQLTDNHADNGGGAGWIGVSDSVSIQDSLVSGNSANDASGGGFYIYGAEALDGGLTIANSQFTNNHAKYDGGGFYATSIQGPIAISNSTFSGNTAGLGSDGTGESDGGVGGAMGFDDLYGVTTITNTTISGNQALDSGGGVYVEDANGGFHVIGSQITGNSAADGGGVYVDYGYGPISFESSTISGNHATNGRGGGLYLTGANGGVAITNTTIANNDATSGGGGIEFWNNGWPRTAAAAAAAPTTSLLVTDSTISGNHANGGNGGGLYAGKLGLPVQVNNSTISGNLASGEGGGIAFAAYYSATDLALVQTTITNNQAKSVGGVYLPSQDQLKSTSHGAHGAAVNEPKNKEGKRAGADKKDDAQAHAQVHAQARQLGPINVSLVGTILALNTGVDIGNSGIATSDHSLLGKVGSTPVTDLGGTILGLDPLLGPLANNGGPTQTHALRDVSPAVNAGPDPVPSFAGNEFDQRGSGFPRVTNNRVDIGAYETPQIVVILPTFTG